MSFQDAICVFMDNLDCAAAVEAQNASHFLDLETSDATTHNGEDIKQLGTVYWNTIVSVAPTAGTAMSLKLITSAAATFTSPVVLASIGTTVDPFGYAQWTLGKTFSIQVPMERCLQFLGVEYVGTTSTALKLDSWLGMEPLTDQNIQKYPT